MRVYIAASLPDRADAAALAVALRERGHEVTSRWHDDASATVEREAGLTIDQRAGIAAANERDIDDADAFILLNERACERHGKWIELRLARSFGLYTHVIGVASVPLMAETCVDRRHASVAAFLEVIR